MTKERDQIIAKIEEQKKNPNLKLKLKERTEYFTNLLFYTLFDSDTEVEKNVNILEQTFEELVDLACWETEKPCSTIWQSYLEKLPKILQKLNKDADSFMKSDPAANSIEEVYLAYPGFYAIAIYRLSHELLKFGLPLVPRLMTEYSHRLTGTDINPGAEIGESFFIDHATGIVIGETAVIKNNVKIYQGVTLGGLYVDRKLRNVKRHPTVEDNVTIYANATILGGTTIIGANSTIGGNAWITSSVPENSIISNSSEIKIKKVI
ncbi:serine O-acetyltransferase EpsC [Aquimarina sp. 2201CG14-23]|uniref:serine O-acetyltransferase EpsC n=1 Tax=Aquimarina mycalae TaxID=3040073 RepID=UPI0024781548|nr:serine O-acetyltransferase EpsC [Aquimarina sp. 2201CG14-23]MDH7446526.1 serine O-acetyltransferase [Aquimarina sp. 2201CG14-23]